MIHLKTRIHAGKWEDCKTCNPNGKPKKIRFKREEEPVKHEGKMTLDRFVRRTLAEELGEEPTRDQKFALLQKYGLAAARIDRNVTKPSWKGKKEWNQQMQEWYKLTKNLVPKEQFKHRSPLQAARVKK